MPSSPLTDDQRELLAALVERHAEAPGPVKRTTLAATVGCHPVTVSTRMGNLRALGLVESTSGPKGGYEPTPKARDALADRDAAPFVDVRVASGGERIDGARIRGVALTDVHDPHGCRGELSLDGSVAEFAVGDAIGIGPMPASGLRIEGVVAERDPTDGVVVFDIEAMHAPSELPSVDPDRETHTLSG